MLSQTLMPQPSCSDLQLEKCPFLPGSLQSTPEPAELNPSISPKYIVVDKLELPASKILVSFLFCYRTQGKHRVNRMEDSSEMLNGLGWTSRKPGHKGFLLARSCVHNDNLINSGWRTWHISSGPSETFVLESTQVLGFCTQGLAWAHSNRTKSFSGVVLRPYNTRWKISGLSSNLNFWGQLLEKLVERIQQIEC